MDGFKVEHVENTPSRLLEEALSSEDPIEEVATLMSGDTVLIPKSAEGCSLVKIAGPCLEDLGTDEYGNMQVMMGTKTVILATYNTYTKRGFKTKTLLFSSM